MVKSRRMRWAGHMEYIWESRHIYSVLVGKPEGKRPLGRHWRRWEEDIEMHLKNGMVRPGLGYIWFRIWTGGGSI